MKKHFLKRNYVVPSVMLIFLLLLPPIIWGQNKKLEKEIEAVISKHAPNASVGIVVLDADNGKTLYEHRSQEPFPPASTAKILTAAAMLWAVGPDYQYQTNIKFNQKNLNDGKLNGNLLFQFSGDPAFKTEDLIALINQIKNKGIQEINGNIILDNSRFSGPEYPLGWSRDAVFWYYGSPITSVIVNENALPIHINSNKKLGELVDVTIPNSASIPITLSQNVITVTKEAAETECQISIDMNNQNQLNVTGCWPIDQSMQLKVAIKNPNLYAKDIIQKTLANLGIKHNGQIIIQDASNTSPELKNQEKNNDSQIPDLLASHASPPLKDLITVVLRDSNNLYAESLLKTLGNIVEKQGSFHGGLKALKSTLTKYTPLDFNKLKLQDGSGLSSYDLLTPNQLAQVLYAMHHQPKLEAVFKEALPGAGQGTLNNRFQDNKAAEIRAKTGTVSGVSTLAGYLKNVKHQDRIFVIMSDHHINNQTAKQFENDLVLLFQKF